MSKDERLLQQGLEATTALLEVIAQSSRADYQRALDLATDVNAVIRARLAQPEPEPVAWFTEDHREDKSATTYSKKMAERWVEKGWPVTPLYTAPPQREWRGLTEEEIESAWIRQIGFLDPRINQRTRVEFARAIEAKLKEKNT